MELEESNTVFPPVLVESAGGLLAGLAAGPALRWSGLDEASQLAVWDSVHNSTVAGHLGAQPAFARICPLPFPLLQEQGQKSALHRSFTAFRPTCLFCKSRRNPQMDPADMPMSAIPTAPGAKSPIRTLLI